MPKVIWENENFRLKSDLLTYFLIMVRHAITVMPVQVAATYDQAWADLRYKSLLGKASKDSRQATFQPSLNYPRSPSQRICLITMSTFFKAVIAMALALTVVSAAPAPQDTTTTAPPTTTLHPVCFFKCVEGVPCHCPCKSESLIKSSDQSVYPSKLSTNVPAEIISEVVSI